MLGRHRQGEIGVIVEEGFTTLFRHPNPLTAEEKEFEVADEPLVPALIILRDFPDLRHVDDR